MLLTSAINTLISVVIFDLIASKIREKKSMCLRLAKVSPIYCNQGRQENPSVGGRGGERLNLREFTWLVTIYSSVLKHCSLATYMR